MLNEFLSRERTAILQRWFGRIMDTYPSEVSGFLRDEPDQILNPVGSAFSQGTTEILDGLIEGAAPTDLTVPLARIVKIRTVQDFSPSEALSFIFLLKAVIRDLLRSKGGAGALLPEELLALESRIDALAAHAFDLYMESREKIFEIRVSEIKKRTFKLLERVNERVDLPEEGRRNKKGDGK